MVGTREQRPKGARSWAGNGTKTGWDQESRFPTVIFPLHFPEPIPSSGKASVFPFVERESLQHSMYSYPCWQNAVVKHMDTGAWDPVSPTSS